MIKKEQKKFKAAFVTLGCDKNTVDSEYIAGILNKSGLETSLASKDSKFDLLLINTCGFINTAKEESVNMVLDWVNFRKKCRRNFKIVVFGCLVQRYYEDLKRDIPEVDLFLGVGNWEENSKKIIYLLNQEKSSENKSFQTGIHEIPDLKIESKMIRQPLEKLPYSFLKIADGCNHKCAFCAIPIIKGKFRSVPIAQIMSEAKYLIERGIKELNLVAQDTTAYGSDLPEKVDLADLLNELASLKGNFKIRILYAYPTGINKRLIDTILSNPKIIRYIDLPLQHLDESILKQMKRPFSLERIIGSVNELREKIKGIVIRTTFIVGMPGEDEKAFKRLIDGIKKLKFERAGVFEYSPEEGTEAAEMEVKIPKKVIHKRKDILMKTQAGITYNYHKSLVGTTQEVLVEQNTNQPDLYYGRGEADAPEVDGGILIKSGGKLNIGDYVKVKITGADVYDLFGEII